MTGRLKVTMICFSAAMHILCANVKTSLMSPIVQSQIHNQRSVYNKTLRASKHSQPYYKAKRIFRRKRLFFNFTSQHLFQTLL